MKRLWYRIKRHLDETTCDQCGTPLYVGDDALWVEDGRSCASVYCSEGCADDVRPDGWAAPIVEDYTD